MARTSIPVAVIVSLCCLVAGPRGSAQTRPAGPPATRPTADFTTITTQLGDADAEVRDHAGKSLWAAGKPAEPALRAAAASNDPEVARRAKAILREFSFGLYPDTPPEIFRLLSAYRKGDAQEKHNAVWGLSSKGVQGLRVLLKLREEERDPELKQMLAQVLEPREHELSILMLFDGQTDELEELLERSAPESPVAAQDYAALLLFTGKLPGKLAELHLQPLTERNAPVLVALARAAGDLPTARAAAQRSGNAELLNAILVEQQDWKTLAGRMAESSTDLKPAEELGFLCAYQRLGGDVAGWKKSIKRLQDRADEHAEDYVTCANDLRLNDAPEPATDVLLRHNDYLQASSFLAPRLKFKPALDLPRQAADHQPGDLTQIKARTVGTLFFLGHTEEARKLMTEVTRENRLRNDFAAWVSLVESARDTGMTRQADELAAVALEKSNGQSPLAPLFEKLGFADSAAATAWWKFLRKEFADDSAARNLARLRDVFDGTSSAEELDAITRLARRYAVDLPVLEREQWIETVADTMTAGHHDELAGQWIKRLEDTPTASSLVHAGDYHAGRKDWPAAIADYARAFETDHLQPTALFLHGWALAQSGAAAEGAAKMELAHRLPLGNETGRYAMVEELSRHKLNDDVKRELELIIHATAPRSWERNDAMRRYAQFVYDGGDYLAAADLWQQAFLQNLGAGVSFSEPWAYAIVPALIHKARSLGMIKAGQAQAALDEARLALDATPADADALIELVNSLDGSGHREAADTLYREQTEVYRKVVADYPDSSPLHNQLAWAQCMCHRDPDDALLNARRAVELDPASTASLDTLAEVYFARGDAASAAAQMQRCVELEPRVERHKRQLERFKAAMKKD